MSDHRNGRSADPGFFREILVSIGRGFGRGLALLFGAAALGAGGGAIWALFSGTTIAVGAVLGLLAVGGIALFILIVGLFHWN